jgi:hypothetical protein
VLFWERSTQPTKKRSCYCLSNDDDIDLPLTALKGVYAMRMLLLTSIKPTFATSDPAMNLLGNCLSFAVKQINGCVSALGLACTNTLATRCTNLAPRKLTGEERRRQKREQLLVSGIKEVNAEGALCFALEYTQATFAFLKSLLQGINLQSAIPSSGRQQWCGKMPRARSRILRCSLAL